MFDLRKTREEQHIRQTDLARKIGVSRQAISFYESGINKPSVETAKKIGEVLRIDWTLFYEDNRQN